MYRRTLPLSRRLIGITKLPAMESVGTTIAADVASAERARTNLQEAADSQALTGLLQSLSSIIDDIRRKRQRTVVDFSQQCVELGVAIAERLLRAGIKLDRQRLDQIVLTSLERLPTSNTVVLRAHPDDVALLQRQIDEQRLLESGRDTFSYQPDQSHPRGRLILEADDLFAEWDTQRSLAEIRSLLLDEIFLEA